MNESDLESRPAGSGVKRGLIGLLIVGAFLLIVLVYLPSANRARLADLRIDCKNNLGQIGLALYLYHEEYGCLPPAYTVDANGNRLHSWRTLILPYLELDSLYRTIDLTKPWDHPDNQAAADLRPSYYACPNADVEDDQATYMALVGEDHCFPGETTLNFDQIRQISQSNIIPLKITVVEVPASRSVHWMKPEDSGVSYLQGLHKGSEANHTGGCQVGFLDGSARFISSTTDQQVLKSLMFLSEPTTDAEF